MVFAIGATVMSLESVKKVSAADQKIIEAIAKRSQKKARAVIRKANEDARKTLLRKGITVVDAPKYMVDESRRSPPRCRTSSPARSFRRRSWTW